MQLIADTAIATADPWYRRKKPVVVGWSGRLGPTGNHVGSRMFGSRSVARR
jgi:hypothetical protein